MKGQKFFWYDLEALCRAQKHDRAPEDTSIYPVQDSIYPVQDHLTRGAQGENEANSPYHQTATPTTSPTSTNQGD